MKRSINILCIVFVIVSLLVVGYNMIGQKSPSEIVKSAYIAGNNGNYAETKKYFSSEFLTSLGGSWRNIAPGNMAAWDKMTKKGTIERFKFIEEKIYGNKANVSFTLLFRDGSQGNINEQLIKENGAWKINL
jgi:hypothetical protein